MPKAGTSCCCNCNCNCHRLHRRRRCWCCFPDATAGLWRIPFRKGHRAMLMSIVCLQPAGSSIWGQLFFCVCPDFRSATLILAVVSRHSRGAQGRTQRLQRPTGWRQVRPSETAVAVQITCVQGLTTTYRPNPNGRLTPLLSLARTIILHCQHRPWRRLAATASPTCPLLPAALSASIAGAMESATLALLLVASAVLVCLWCELRFVSGYTRQLCCWCPLWSSDNPNPDPTGS